MEGNKGEIEFKKREALVVLVFCGRRIGAESLAKAVGVDELLIALLITQI